VPADLVDDDSSALARVFSPTTMIGDEVLRAILGIGPKYRAIAKLPAIERLRPFDAGPRSPSVAAGPREDSAVAS
jgi:hypothetical protein